MDTRYPVVFSRIDRAEFGVCRLLNRTSGYFLIRSFFQAISRLGDGWLWYSLIAAIPFVYGPEGWLPLLHLLVVGAISLAIYKLIKPHAVRERPFITHPAIKCASAPLDRFSFPSGHTLHAVCFTMTAVSYFPELGPSLLAFTVLVALSRVVLGLHYPSDVAVGAAIGGSVATAGIWAASAIVA
jgi:undecaprenyl-diphosphatase